MALAMGADAFVQSGDNEIGEVAEALGGRPDIVLECIGVPGLLGTALAHVKTFGRVVSMGFCTTTDPIVPAAGAWKHATLSFHVGYTVRDFEYSADTLDAGHADPRMMVTATTTLDALPDMIDALRQPNDETKVQVLVG